MSNHIVLCQFMSLLIHFNVNLCETLYGVT